MRPFPRTRAVYLCNPNNPTGTAVSAAAIREFIAASRNRSSPSWTRPTWTSPTKAWLGRDLVDGDRRVVVLRTFSKLHGMAGMRLGYAITRPEIAVALRPHA
jgi:histidinol-phosphate aminotransferase